MKIKYALVTNCADCPFFTTSRVEPFEDGGLFAPPFEGPLTVVSRALCRHDDGPRPASRKVFGLPVIGEDLNCLLLLKEQIPLPDWCPLPDWPGVPDA